MFMFMFIVTTVQKLEFLASDNHQKREGCEDWVSTFFLIALLKCLILRVFFLISQKIDV